MGALYTFGFIDILEAITLVESVPDAQMFAANFAWFQALPKDLQSAFEAASEKTQARELRADPGRAQGVDGQRSARPASSSTSPPPPSTPSGSRPAGEQRPEWNDIKKELAGSIAKFDKLKAAANTKGKFTVDD